MVNFDEVKARVSLEDACAKLGIVFKYVNETQKRTPCPRCNAGGDRALVITPDKGMWYCFSAKTGGDQIALVAHIKNVNVKEAAEFLASGEEHTGLQPLTYLDPRHESLQDFGISPETYEHFGAGYAGKGIMRGKLAIPIHDLKGQLVAYCGRSVTDTSLIFPKGFDPTNYVFNLHRLSGDITLVHDPLEVLQAYEHGVENVAAFLGERHE